jgi:hypothetical protein
VSFILSVANKPIMLSVVMLSVVAPQLHLQVKPLEGATQVDSVSNGLDLLRFLCWASKCLPFFNAPPNYAGISLCLLNYHRKKVLRNWSMVVNLNTHVINSCIVVIYNSILTIENRYSCKLLQYFCSENSLANMAPSHSLT